MPTRSRLQVGSSSTTIRHRRKAANEVSEPHACCYGTVLSAARKAQYSLLPQARHRSVTITPLFGRELFDS